MHVEHAIRSRRTTKAYGPDPVPEPVLRELLELACWAPNHRLTEPWRFRVLGPAARGRLEVAAGEGAAKLRRAPTLVVASYVRSRLPLHAEEDAQAAGCAVYAVLLGAHGRGIASYWRTPAVLRSNAGRAAVDLPADEHVLGLLHFGTPAGAAAAAPPRRPSDDYVWFLD